MADTMNRGMGNTGQQPRHSNQGQGGARQEESAGGLAGSVLEGAQNVASTVGHAAEQAWDTTRQYATQAGSAVANAAETAWDGSRAARLARRWGQAVRERTLPTMADLATRNRR